MQDYVTITLDMTVEDDQVEAALDSLQHRLLQAGYQPMEGEITVTRLPDEALPLPPRVKVTKHRPC